MKVKMFSGQNPINTEETINDWLMKSNVKICFIKQSVLENQIVIISVWYKEKTMK